MIKLDLEGSYYEIGLSVGEKCRNLVSSYYAEECSKDKINFAYECQKSVKKHCPELLEELQGIADGGGFDHENLISSELAAGLKPNCTLLAISSKYTKNGHPLFARSMDWFQNVLKFASVSVTKPTKKFASIGFSETFLGRLGGVNEAGLAIGEASTCWENLQPGIINGIAIRWILDTCRTAYDAVSFLQKIPYIMGNNYLIADKEDNFALVEAHPAKTIATIGQKNFLAAMNHYFSPDFDKITPTKPKHSIDRMDYLNSWFKKRANPVDLEDLMMIQQTHDVEICPHVQESYEGKLRDLTTCWAWIAPLGEDKVYLCEGSPCKNEYKEYFLS
jgi:predicted choloylglycine hydrolase